MRLTLVFNYFCGKPTQILLYCSVVEQQVQPFSMLCGPFTTSMILWPKPTSTSICSTYSTVVCIVLQYYSVHTKSWASSICIILYNTTSSTRRALSPTVPIYFRYSDMMGCQRYDESSSVTYATVSPKPHSGEEFVQLFSMISNFWSVAVKLMYLWSFATRAGCFTGQ